MRTQIQHSGEIYSWIDMMNPELLERWWNLEKWIGRGMYKIESLYFGYSGIGMRESMSTWSVNSLPDGMILILA